MKKSVKITLVMSIATLSIVSQSVAAQAIITDHECPANKFIEANWCLGQALSPGTPDSLLPTPLPGRGLGGGAGIPVAVSATL